MQYRVHSGKSEIQMTRFCLHCGVDAPNADQCGSIVGTRHVFVEGNTSGIQLSPPVNFMELFPSHIFHICILLAKDTETVHAEGADINSAILNKPDMSASAIAKKNPEKYDIFAQICAAGSYFDNARLQDLVDLAVDQPLVTSFRCALCEYLQYVDTFRNIPGGSESALVDCNLQHMLALMAIYSKGKLTCTKTNTIQKDSMYLAGSASPEHCLQFISRSLSSPQVVIGSEVKGVEASVRTCLPQLISVCGSRCIEMHRLGLNREACVVPGIVVAGASCQFYAMYLLKDTFPVLVALSPELSLFGTLQEELKIAEWCLRLVSFASATGDQLLLSHETKRASVVAVRLNMTGYFAKPVRNGLRLLSTAGDQATPFFSQKHKRLNHIMRLYEQMRVACRGLSIDVKSLILFPEGVVAVSGDDVPESKALRAILISECVRNGFTEQHLSYGPLILFPRLSAADGWRNDKPPEAHRQSYLTQLQSANAAINAAQVAHLDERPANIMWRVITVEDFTQVELRLIDFEDAELFNYVIPSEFVATVVENGDSRYPFTSGDEKTEQLAKRFHNDFFLEAVSQWAISEIVDFGEFMKQNGADILSNIQ